MFVRPVWGEHTFGRADILGVSRLCAMQWLQTTNAASPLLVLSPTNRGARVYLDFKLIYGIA